MNKTEKKGGFSGFVLDPAQCNQLSMKEKREVIREVAQWSEDAPEILSSFSRKELLEIICAEMGKERKYSGYTKLQMIKHLLKLVSQKSKRSNTTDIKRERQRESQKSTNINLVFQDNSKEVTRVCQNVACKAALSSNDAFCRRCSCCICHYFDDNKDPSLWLTCGSDSVDEKSCGLTCHLMCAFKDERTGIMKIGYRTNLDGKFNCVSCGKVNELMRTWRKQLLIAQEARRVDVLCFRVLLGYKILTATDQYKELRKTLESALQLLNNELGPLDLVHAKMARGIVNRLSCGAEVQNLCASAVEAFDTMSSDCNVDHMENTEPVSCQIRFEESFSTSVVIELENTDKLSDEYLGCMLWHRDSTVKDYPHEPNRIILKPEKSFQLTDLTPSTEYFCKVSFFGKTGILRVMEAKWTTPASNEQTVADLVEYEEEILSQVKTTDPRNINFVEDCSKRSQPTKHIKKYKNERLCSLPSSMEAVSPVSPRPLSPPTPCKSSGMLEVSGLSCKKRREESAYEYSVKVIKWLEYEGHIEEDFRVKFLTWFSLKATTQDRRVVNAFVDALIDDPASLAGQLIHSFADEICCERRTFHQNGFCTRLWH